MEQGDDEMGVIEGEGGNEEHRIYRDVFQRTGPRNQTNQQNESST